ncbi:MAG TPA: hypothetical protein VJ276_16150 [Thermoanaerobaculia bacterium]|nr:hypothetical protein [Thermoanaerobaculia bacterium]
MIDSPEHEPHMPHEAFLEVPHGSIKSASGWPPLSAENYERAGKQYDRFELKNVRLETAATGPVFRDMTDDHIPPLGKIIKGFAPISPRHVEYDDNHRDVIAAHFDTNFGTLRVASFDKANRFTEPHQWPPPNGLNKVPFPLLIVLDLEVPDADVVITGQFYPDGSTRTLILEKGTSEITIGNLIPDDIVGGDPPVDRRHHFKMYWDLADNRQNQPIPEANTPFEALAISFRKWSRRLLPFFRREDEDRGFSGGCSDTRYPP